MKNFEELERVVKGFGNRRRLQILFIIAKEPKITVDGLAGQMDISYKTLSVHTRQLYNSGLITKKYAAQSTEHNLTPLGKNVIQFLRKI